MGDALLADLHAAAAPHAAPVIAAALATLERALPDRAWLLDEAFTVADLNVAAVLSPSRSSRLHLTPYPRVARGSPAATPAPRPSRRGRGSRPEPPPVCAAPISAKQRP